MVLHKQLRVINKETPCMVFRTNNSNADYSGKAYDILSRLTGIQSPLRDSFVKEVSIINDPEVAIKIVVKARDLN